MKLRKPLVLRDWSIIKLSDTISDERAFISWVEKMVTTEGNLLGHREDAIAVQQNDSIMVVNIDGWVASSDRPEGMTPQQVGYRSVANAISDVIAKGARPEGMVISSSVAPRYKTEVKEIIKGFVKASQDFNTPYFGGDMNSSSDLVIDVTVWGRCNRLLRRDGAEDGDNVYWLGPALGCTAAALGILTEGWMGDKDHALDVMGYPNLFFEILNFHPSASVDSSDGVAKSLYLIANASGVRIELDGLPDTADWIRDVAADNQIELKDLYFYGGEELGIIFTCPPDEKVPANAQLLGSVEQGHGVFFEGDKIPDRGWDHFAELE